MTHDKLEEWLNTVSKIIFDVKIGLDNADRLFAKKYPDEEKALRHGFFSHHYYQLWFICTVQLSKLVTPTKSQSYNLHFLINELKTGQIDNYLQALIERNKNKLLTKNYRNLDDILIAMKEYKGELKKHADTIKKISNSRNKLYAHREQNAKPENLTLEQVRELLNVCIKIYNGIRGGFYDISVDFSHTTDWSIDWVIKKCAQKHQSQRPI